MIYDISQKIFGCKTYPNDPTPKKEIIESMDKGSLYNLSSFSMCAHNGTHIDAPLHFIKNGKSIDQIDLNKLIGPCYVYTVNGTVDDKIAKDIINKARSYNIGADKRILIKGNATVSLEAAIVFKDENIYLIGNESQSVGPIEAPMSVHLRLLEKEIVLLEGIVLDKVSDGVYELYCLPINLNGLEGAPCRAILKEIP